MYLSDPKKVCEFLLETCRERGVELHVPVRPTGLARDENGRLCGLMVTNENEHEELSMSSVYREVFKISARLILLEQFLAQL